jgi:hypothetical protein
VPISSCWVIVRHFRLSFFFLWLGILALFFLRFHFLRFQKLFKSIGRNSKSLSSLFQIFLVLEVSIANKLFFRQFHYFFFVHASSVKSFRTASTLENGHCISTDSTGIAIVKRTSKMKRVCINILEKFLYVILFNAFWMEVLSAVCSWTFGHFILFLESFRNILYFFRLLLRFGLFVFLVFSTIVKSFVFTYQTCNKVTVTVRAGPSGINDIFDSLIIHWKLKNIQFSCETIKRLVSFIFEFLSAFLMERPLAKTHAIESAFRLLAKST